jgi:sporulation protein YlmC with PRC-barrel domain
MRPLLEKEIVVAKMMVPATMMAILLASAGVSAHAQSSSGTSASPSAQVPQARQLPQGPGAEMTAGANQFLLTALRQKPVYTMDRAAVGEIEDVLVDMSGAVQAVLVDVGQGRSQRLVAIPITGIETRPLGGVSTQDSGAFEVFLRMSREDFGRAPLFHTAGRKL